MAKLSQLERAIAGIDSQIEVLQLARKHLVEQQTKKPAKRAKVVKASDAAA